MHPGVFWSGRAVLWPGHLVFQGVAGVPCPRSPGCRSVTYRDSSGGKRRFLSILADEPRLLYSSPIAAVTSSAACMAAVISAVPRTSVPALCSPWLLFSSAIARVRALPTLM